MDTPGAIRDTMKPILIEIPIGPFQMGCTKPPAFCNLGDTESLATA